MLAADRPQHGTKTIFDLGVRVNHTLIVISALIACVVSPFALAQTNGEASTTSPKTLRIGVKTAPPFVIKSEDGTYSGLAIELWQEIAQQENVQGQFFEAATADDLISGVATQEFDIGVGALTVTPARERTIDFTQPYFNAGLGIATQRGNSGLWTTVKRLVSWQFVSAVAVLGVVLLAVGVLMWLLERRANAEQFGGSASTGIGNGFWWSAVTMTTVGYGDKSPITLAGRLLGLIWMFAGIITVSGFTAAIASALTVDQLSTKVAGVNDLPKVRVATVAGTASADFLNTNGIRFRGLKTPQDALDALSKGTVDAVVHDRPILRHLLQQQADQSLLVLSAPIRPEDYAFALPQGSALREQLNPVLLEIVQSDDWAARRAAYLGQ